MTARIDELRAEARYHQQRFDLYRAKMLSSRPTSLKRLRELEQAQARAAARLEHALRRES